MQDLQDFADRAEAIEDIEELRELLHDVVEVAEEAQEGVESVRVDASRNRDLAEAVLAFAKWQTSGYEGDTHTRDVVSRTLWGEVSNHVRAILGECPEAVGAEPAQLDFGAALGSTGGVRDGAEGTPWHVG